MEKMKYVELQGQRMPALGLGTWQLTGEKCAEAVENALNMGYRHVDTAQSYGNEAEVGEGIKNSEVDREEVWLTTKLWRDNLNAENLEESVNRSLEKLKTDYIDLLLIHWPFPGLDLEEALEEMNSVLKKGKARNIGVSNFNTRQMENAQKLSDHKLLANQVEYHPFLNQDKVLDKCREQETMLTAYSPLARGEVIGNSLLKEIGEKYGKSEAQITLRWLVQQEKVAAIPKATSVEHQEANLDIFDFQLSEDEMENISNLANGTRKVNPNFAPEWD